MTIPEEVSESLEQRLAQIAPHFDKVTQTELRRMIETLPDMALAGMQGLGCFSFSASSCKSE